MRTIKPAFRICRQRRTRAGVALDNVPNRFGSDATTIHADTPEAAVAQAKAFGLTGELVAVPEAN